MGYLLHSFFMHVIRRLIIFKFTSLQPLKIGKFQLGTIFIKFSHATLSSIFLFIHFLVALTVYTFKLFLIVNSKGTIIFSLKDSCSRSNRD